MRSKARSNIGTALLAVVLSLIVWINATYQGDKPQTDYFPQAVEIAVLNAPSGFVVTNNPANEVQVQIKAFTSTWKPLTAKDFSAVADWSSLQEGMNEVPVKVTCANQTVTILDYQPQTVFVRLEPWRSDKQLDVTVVLTDQDTVPLGYDVIDPHAEPAYVNIEGAASAVERAVKLVATVSLLNQRTSIERLVDLVALDAEGQRVEGVQFASQGTLLTSVKVQVEIRKSQNFREVAVRARTKGQPAKSYFVSGVDVEPPTVTVFGIPEVIDLMGGLVDLKDQVDVTGATRLVAGRLPLDLPEGVQVLGASEDEEYLVLVTVEIDAVTGYTTVELPLSTKRLQDGLVAKPSVTEVEVILTGPAAAVDELQTDLLEAYVDLAGLGVGTHQVKPAVDIVASAADKLRDLVIKDVSPKSIEVTIAEPPTATPTPTPTQTATRTPTATIEAIATVPVSATQTVTATVTLAPEAVTATPQS